MHMCFGYAAVHKERGLGKPGAYSFLPQLNRSNANQISIEAAQPKIDLKILSELPDKTIILGVIDNGDLEVESPEIVAARIREALKYVEPRRLIPAPDCGMKYLDRSVAFGKLCSLVRGTEIVRQSLGG